MARRPSLADLARQRDLYDILLEHALRGLRIQVLVRWVLVVFVAAVVVVVPPEQEMPCLVIVAAYAVWAVAFTFVTRRAAQAAARFAWLALLGDVLAVGTLAVLASGGDHSTWTADIVVNGLFLVPLLAATQLRPLVCAAVATPTVVVYLGASVSARVSHLEPLSSVLLRTFALAGLAVGCVLLSRVQRSRVLDIGGLAVERSRLLAEILQIEERERRELAENLHDGALQYLLAARQDLVDGRGGDTGSLDRVDEALSQSSALLRSAMAELHPAVLGRAGLPAAVRSLVGTTARRHRLEGQVHDEQWPTGLRTDVDGVLYAVARELVSNVVKHAGARRLDVTLAFDAPTARLVVRDDGAGMGPDVASERLGQGHIGLASHQARVEAAGGTLVVGPGEAAGTVAHVELPVPPER